jgi:hypothetical protein
MKATHCKAPCANCPFRKDSLGGWLDNSIDLILEQDSFVCHKHRKNKKQCAGHMLLKGKDNAYVRLASCLEVDLQLQGRDLIFDTEKQCIEHHKSME